MEIEKAFGFVLSNFRNNAQMSQEKLALLSDLDRTYISLLERGKRKPTISTIFSLCRTLNIKPHELILEVEELLKN